jgi:lysylphosphatidylglycerol synthetase-like protein (DUF2156 family)
VIRRIPFTACLIPTVLIVSALAGLLSRPIAADQLARWGFGLEDLGKGDLWKLLTAPFLILRPYMAVTISAILLFFVGSCELVLRTRRTIVSFAISHVVGYVGAMGLISLLGSSGWASATTLAGQRDVGASNGAFGTLGTLLLFLSPSLRAVGLLATGTYLLSALVLDGQIWDVQHILAFTTGAALGALFLRHEQSDLTGLRLPFAISHRLRPAMMAWMVGGMGALNILGALLLPQHSGFERLEALMPLGLVHGPRHLLFFFGLLLLLLVPGLARGQRAAWWAAFLALLVTIALQLELGITKLEGLLASAFLLGLVVWKDDFPAKADPPELQGALRGLTQFVLAVVLGSWLCVLAVQGRFEAFPGAGPAFVDVCRRIFFSRVAALEPVDRQAAWLLEAIPLLFWTGVLLQMTQLLRTKRAPRPVRSDRERARRIALDHGETSSAFMSTWQGNSCFFDVSQQCFLAYQVHAGVAVILGDPTGPADRRLPALRGFQDFCTEHGWSSVVVGATESARELYAESGYLLLQMGEEAVIPLDGLAFRGKQWQNMRTALNRARKKGITFSLVEGGHVPPALETQLFAINRDWERAQKLPPLEFTLGRIEDVRDPAVEVALAVDASGRVEGFVDWLPMPARKGWVIDLMRRRPDAMSGTMEFLIGMSLLAFQQRGDRLASLATAPLADLDRAEDDQLLPKVLGVVYSRFQTYYNFQSLFDFKDRFQPRWQPVYLAYPDPAVLPAALIAILRAYLPRMGWVDAVR